MAYMLAKNKEMMFDFFALLHALQYAGRYGEICPRPYIGINAKVSDAYYRLHNMNCTLNRNLKLFFTHRRDQEITFFDWLFISGVDTYLSSDDLIGAIVKIDPHKMRR